jgi:hypothetical protein
MSDINLGILNPEINAKNYPIHGHFPSIYAPSLNLIE